MINGKIKWFNRKEGYGVVTDESGRDFRVSDGSFAKDIDESWIDGQPVEFDLVGTGENREAINLEAGSAPIRIVFLDGVSDSRISQFTSLLSKVMGIKLYVSARQDRHEVDPAVNVSIQELS